MKKYKFKLEALLKIRKLKEEQCKMEIGRIQVRIKELENQIAQQDAGINEAYDMQEKALERGMEGLEVRFHPYYVEGKRTHIRALEMEKSRYQEYVEYKYEELSKLRADVKVITQMKEKDHLKYKKNLEKKMNERIEEQVQNWRMVLSKEA